MTCHPDVFNGRLGAAPDAVREMIVQAANGRFAWNGVRPDRRVVAIVGEGGELCNLRVAESRASEFAACAVYGKLPRSRGIAPARLGGSDRTVLELQDERGLIFQFGGFVEGADHARHASDCAEQRNELANGVDAHVEERADAGAFGIEKPKVVRFFLAENLADLAVVHLRSAVAGTGASAGDFADDTVGDEFSHRVNGTWKMGQAKHGAIGLLDAARERMSLFHLATERFLHDQMLTGFQRRDPPADMLRVRRGNDDGIEVGVSDHVLVTLCPSRHSELVA